MLIPGGVEPGKAIQYDLGGGNGEGEYAAGTELSCVLSGRDHAHDERGQCAQGGKQRDSTEDEI